MSKRHPARKPFGPMRIRLVIESAGGGLFRMVIS
jgi:hypothetical protein